MYGWFDIVNIWNRNFDIPLFPLERQEGGMVVTERKKCRYCGNLINGDQFASYCSGNCAEDYRREEEKKREMQDM